MEGWYDAERTCLMPFSLRNCCSEVNWALLSDTNHSGKPQVDNILLRSTMVFSPIVVIIGVTSGYFTSTIIRNDFPRNRPTKSICRCCHGCVGQVHGWRTVGAGLFVKHWHDLHFVPSLQFLSQHLAIIHEALLRISFWYVLYRILPVLFSAAY